MIKLEPKNKKALLKTALGLEPADLAINNCRLVNVFTGEIYPAVVYVKDGFIAHVETEKLEGPYGALEIYDGEGRYLIPYAYRKLDDDAQEFCQSRHSSRNYYNNP